MTLTEIKYVLMLAQKKHFGKAAEACHVSQPTLSTAIAKLEDNLGVLIFERNRNQVQVTEMGRKIVTQAQIVLDQANHLLAIAQEGKSELSLPLKVGAIYTVGPYLFPAIIPKLQKIAPKMPLIIHEDYTSNLRTKLLDGELDAIFISLPFNHPGIVTHVLYDEPLMVVMRNNHPLGKQKKISPRDLAGENILLLGENHCLREQVKAACPRCFSNPAYQEMAEGASIDTLRHMVASGLGITILPSSAAQMQYYSSTLTAKPFGDHVPVRQIALAWRASYTRPKAIGALIEALHKSSIKGICLLP